MASRRKDLRVLVLFGNIPLLGQERGNIEVFTQLKPLSVDALFVTHDRWGHQQIQPELDRRALAWTTATYIDRLGKRMTAGAWLRNFWRICIASWQLRQIVRAYRPTHIHFANYLFFVNFAPYLLLDRIPIVCRVGDKPAVHNIYYRSLWEILGSKVSTFVCISFFIRDKMMTIAHGRKNLSYI